jgi:hypothetical protein
MKRFSVILIVAAVVALAVPALAATSAASLNGTYAFQLSSVTDQYGYYACEGDNCTWIQVTGQCPSGQSCSNQAFLRASAGTFSFNGKGTLTFLTITQYNEGSGGPVPGTTCSYSVSGFVANLTNCATKGTSVPLGAVALSLGSFNAKNIATTVLILASDTNEPDMGIAILQ